MQGIRRLLPLVAWLTALGVGIAAFHHLGAGALAPPPLLEPDQWPVWAAEREPLQVVVALLRLVVLAVAWYLVGVTTIGLVARLSQVAGLIRLTDALTVPVVRRTLQAVLGLGLATAVVGAAVTVPAPPGSGPSAPVAADVYDPQDSDPQVLRAEGLGTPDAPAASETDRGVDHPGSDARPTGGPVHRPDPGAGASGAARDPLPLELLAPPEPTETAPQPTEPAPGPVPTAGTDDAMLPGSASAAGTDGDTLSGSESAAGAEADTLPDPVPPATPPAPSPEAGEQRYVVVSGDSLWLIAARTLEQHWPRAPLDVEVVTYWQQVMEVNRSRLADPEVPDLIFPDQELVLPVVPAPPSDAVAGETAGEAADNTDDAASDVTSALPSAEAGTRR